MTDDLNLEETPRRVHEEHEDVRAGSEDKHVHDTLPELTDDELSRLSVLQPGTALDQGAVYLDLHNRARGPFKALGGQEVGPSEQIISKKMTDYEMWNYLTGGSHAADVARSE